VGRYVKLSGDLTAQPDLDFLFSRHGWHIEHYPEACGTPTRVAAGGRHRPLEVGPATGLIEAEERLRKGEAVLATSGVGPAPLAAT
jgi:hypothetical protein